MDLIFLPILALLVLGFVYFQFRRISDLEKTVQRSEAISAALTQECEGLRKECEGLQRECKTLRDDPPAPSDLTLADYLGRLGSRAVDQAERLQRARIRSAISLVKITEMATTSRVVTRKPKLARLQADLEGANAELARLTDCLLAAISPVEGVIDALRRGDIAESVGDRACDEVNRCIISIKKEADEEAPNRGILHEPTDEFRMQLASKDRAKDLARSEREAQRQAAELAFTRHKLPPLTPLEKFRSLKSFGQRDSFG
jgi:hypothetical protein